MCRAWIALLVILILGLLQPPAECRRIVAQVIENQATYGNDGSAKNNGDTGQPPPIIDTVKTPSGTEKSDVESQDRKTNTAINSQIRYFNGGLLVAALLTFGVGILQWRTYSAQTEIFKSQNRAFVYLEPLKLESMSTEGEISTAWRIRASFRNSGTTPARRLLIDIQRSDLSDAQLEYFPFTPDYSGARRMFIGPQASIEIHGPVFGVGDIESLFGENKIHVLIWGWAEYDDAFSTSRHRTEFCFELSGDVVVDLDHPLATQNVPHFIMYNRHNGADGECMYRPRAYQG
jgi:hypothetical protein